MTTLPTSNLRPETASTIIIATKRGLGNVGALHWEIASSKLSWATEMQLLNVPI